MLERDKKFLFTVIYFIVLVFTIYFSYAFISSYIHQKQAYELFKQSWQYVADTNFETEVEIDEETNEEKVVNLISTPEQLAGAFIQSNNVQAESITSMSGENLSGSTYRLTCNINLDSKSWLSNDFSGTFDGGSFVISNLTASGGFVNTLSGTIKSIVFESVKITNSGVVAKNMKSGVISNINVISGSISGEIVGGIVGTMSGGTVQNCSNMVSVTGETAGGIAGSCTGGTITKCRNYNSVSCKSSGVVLYSCGGICGSSTSGNTISKCVNRGNVYCNISATNIRVGGIAGYFSGKLSVCANYGDISGKNNNQSSGGCYSGGVVGMLDGAQIENCYNNGKITSSAVAVNVEYESTVDVLFLRGQDQTVYFYKSYGNGRGADYSMIGGQRTLSQGTYKESKKSTTWTTVCNAWTGGIVGYVTNTNNVASQISGCLNMGKISDTSGAGKTVKHYNLYYKCRESSSLGYSAYILVNQNFSYTVQNNFGSIVGFSGGSKISNCYDNYSKGTNFNSLSYTDFSLTQTCSLDTWESVVNMNYNVQRTASSSANKMDLSYGAYFYTINMCFRVERSGSTINFYVNPHIELSIEKSYTLTYADTKYDSYSITTSWTPSTYGVTKGYPSDTSIWNDNYELKNLYW